MKTWFRRSANTSDVYRALPWKLALDLRFQGGCTLDTGLRAHCTIDGQSVAGIKDWSSWNNSPTQSTSASQATYQVDRTSHIETLGSDDVYNFPAADLGTAALHGFAVVDFTGVFDGARHPLFAGTSGRAPFLRVGRLSESGQLQIGDFTAGAYASTVAGMPQNAVTFIEFQITTGANNTRVRVNNAAQATGTAAGAPDAAITTLLRDSFSQFWIGKLHCLYIHQGSILPASQVTYLRTRAREEFDSQFAV
jgi:hypothetical protein